MASRHPPFCVRRVAIIGAGPAGTAAAKFIAAENHFTNITVFEQRSTTGGIWNYKDSCNEKSKSSLNGNRVEADMFPSPLYDNLESNIPGPIMQYSDAPFADDTPLLPGHRAVLHYLQCYAQEIISLIKFKKKILDVRPSVAGKSGSWVLRVKDVGSGEEQTSVFDAVLVATGRYDRPYVPDVRGLAKWKEAYPDAVSHSKFYRSPEDFRDKKVIIVGYSASGVDIGSQIEAVCTAPMLVSQKASGNLSPQAQPQLATKFMQPEIAEFKLEDRAVHFANGHIEKHVDRVVFCTGYSYSYPFLSSVAPFSQVTANNDVYQHIFYPKDPTLAFVLLPLRVVAFPFCESQAALIARIWSNRLSLPSTAAMEEWVSALEAERGTGKAFHKMSFPHDANYMNDLYRWCMQADKRGGLINDGSGKLPPEWGPEMMWIRQKVHSIKQAVQDRGPERHSIKHLSDVGFDFGTDSSKMGHWLP